MKRSWRPPPLLATLLLVITPTWLAGTGPAHAEMADAENDLFDLSLGELEMFVVTAQKRPESLQDVPLSVSAFDGDMVENAGLLTIEDITMQTPGFANSTYNPATPQPYIRGVGTNSSSVGDDASVGVFVDEVYSGRAGGYRADFFDVERIEVLRGPQGTLYGRNVAGGAMNVITKNPTDELEGYITAMAGDYDLWGLNGALSGPLGERARGRVAFTTRNRDGHTDNVVTGSELRDEDNASVRGKLEFDPSDTVSVLLSVDYSSDDLEGPAARGFTNLPGLSTNDDQNKVSLTLDGVTERDIWGASARIEADLWGGVLTSITAYRRNDYGFIDDLTGTFLIPLINEADEDSRQFSQEIRFAGGSGGWEYIVGVYYFDEDIDRVETFDSSGLAGIPGFSRPMWAADNETTSYAIFGEASYDVSATMTLIAGGRFTYDEKEFDNVASNPDLLGFLLEAYTVSTDDDWDEFTPRLGVKWRPSDEVLVFATFSQGFKAGGFNGLAATAAEAVTSFNPEQATNYEVGIKSDLLDRRLRVNAAAFFTDYENLQNFFLDEGIVVTATADAEIYGFELEAWATVGEGLDLNASYAYLHTEYTSFPSNPSIEGNNLMRSPENSASLGVQYATEVGRLGTLLARADWLYQDKTFYNVENSPESGTDSFDILNARLSLDVNEHFNVSLFGRNLTDEEYFVHAFDLLGGGFVIYGDPRMWGVSATYLF